MEQGSESEELKNYKVINTELSNTLENLRKQVAKLKKENTFRAAESKRKNEEVRELEEKMAHFERIREEHIQNLKACIQLAIIKKNNFNSEKIKNDKLAAELLTKASITNDREQSAIESNANAIATTMVKNSPSTSAMSTSTQLNYSKKKIQATTNSNGSAIFKNLTASQFWDNVITTEGQKRESKMVVATKVGVTETLESSIVSENETSSITAAGSRPKRNVGSRSYVEPKLNTKLRRRRI